MIRSDVHCGRSSGPPKAAALLTVGLLAGLATYAYADFGPAQGGSGGLSKLTPWTEAINAAGYALSDVGNVTIDGTTVLGDGAADTVSLGSTNLFAFGGTSSTFPALRYGSAAGQLEFLRADGTADSMILRAATNGDLTISGDNGNGGLFVSSDSDCTLYDRSNDPRVDVQSDKTQLMDDSGSAVASIGSQGLSLVSADPLQLKDQTSAPTVTDGYGGLYVLNDGGTQKLQFTGQSSTTTLAIGGGAGVAQVIGCSVYYTGADLTPGAGSSTAAPYDTEHYDSHGFHSTASNQERFTIPVGLGGVYQITWHQRLNVNTPAASEVFCWLRKNGTTTLADGLSHIPDAHTYNYLSGATTFRLADGDYCELLFYFEGGAARSIVGGGSAYSTASITRIGD